MAFVLEGDFVTVEACFEDVFCHPDINFFRSVVSFYGGFVNYCRLSVRHWPSRGHISGFRQLQLLVWFDSVGWLNVF